MRSTAFCFWVSFGLFLAGLVFGQIFSRVCFTCGFPDIPGHTWAAFIQAIASVGGIAVAWHLARSQWRQHLHHEKAKDDAVGRTVAVLIWRAAVTLTAIGSSKDSLHTSPSPTIVHALNVIASKLESLDLAAHNPAEDIIMCSLASANEIRKYLKTLDLYSAGAVSANAAQKNGAELKKFYEILQEKYEGTQNK